MFPTEGNSHLETSNDEDEKDDSDSSTYTVLSFEADSPPGY